jgi:hypothetical protein
MTRARTVLGLIAALILILSSAAHTILGWKALSARLAGTNAPLDLIQGLRIGWEFGGAAMLTFGIIVAVTFLRRLPVLPVFLIAVLYVAFGAYAFTATGNPFFFIFIGPGALLLFAAWPR